MNAKRLVRLAVCAVCVCVNGFHSAGQYWEKEAETYESSYYKRSLDNDLYIFTPTPYLSKENSELKPPQMCVSLGLHVSHTHTHVVCCPSSRRQRGLCFGEQSGKPQSRWYPSQTRW